MHRQPESTSFQNEYFRARVVLECLVDEGDAGRPGADHDEVIRLIENPLPVASTGKECLPRDVFRSRRLRAGNRVALRCARRFLVVRSLEKGLVIGGHGNLFPYRFCGYGRGI